MNSMRCSGVMCFTFFTVFALSAAAQSPSEVLEKLKAFDSIIQAGGSISGTQIGLDDHSQYDLLQQGIVKVRKNWKLTFEQGRAGYLIETVDHEKPAYQPPPQPAASNDPRIRMTEQEMARFNGGWMRYQIRSMHWLYWGDELAGHHYVDKVMTMSPENETAVIGMGYNSVLYAANSTEHDALKQTLLLSLGRFFSTLIHEVSAVERLPDGRLRVSAVGKKSEHQLGRWELVIEPDAAWMVREARFYWDAGPDEINFEMVNSGTTWSGAYCIPEKAVCNYFGPIEGYLFPIDELTFDPVVKEFDEEFYAAAKHAVTTARPPNLTITDNRVSPPLRYRPDKAARTLSRDVARESRLIARDVERAVEDVQLPEPGVSGAVFPVISSVVASEPAARPWYRLSKLWAGIILVLSASMVVYAYFFISKSR